MATPPVSRAASALPDRRMCAAGARSRRLLRRDRRHARRFARGTRVHSARARVRSTGALSARDERLYVGGRSVVPLCAATPAPSARSPAALPVSDRNTSSSDGWRMPRSSRAMPSSCRRCPAAISTRVAPLVGRLIRRWSGSMRGVPCPSSAIRAAARSRSAALATRASSTSPPIRSLSSAAVPCATTAPASITTMRCARCSASSMYWVVSSTVVPAATRSSMKLHTSLRVRGSRPVVGSSRNRTRGRPIRLAPTSSRRRIPPE